MAGCGFGGAVLWATSPAVLLRSVGVEPQAFPELCRSILVQARWPEPKR